MRLSLTSRPVAAFPNVPAGRLPHSRFRGLLSVHSRCGPHGRWITLGDPLHRSASNDVVTSIIRSDCYRLERQFAGRDSHPLRDGAFPRHTVRNQEMGYVRPRHAPPVRVDDEDIGVVPVRVTGTSPACMLSSSVFLTQNTAIALASSACKPRRSSSSIGRLHCFAILRRRLPGQPATGDREPTPLPRYRQYQRTAQSTISPLKWRPVKSPMRQPLAADHADNPPSSRTLQQSRRYPIRYISLPMPSVRRIRCRSGANAWSSTH